MLYSHQLDPFCTKVDIHFSIIATVRQKRRAPVHAALPTNLSMNRLVLLVGKRPAIGCKTTFILSWRRIQKPFRYNSVALLRGLYLCCFKGVLSVNNRLATSMCLGAVSSIMHWQHRYHGAANTPYPPSRKDGHRASNRRISAGKSFLSSYKWLEGPSI